MIIDNEKQELIRYLVEKVTKGVKKQLKGYVTQAVETIEQNKKNIKFLCDDYERTYQKTKLLRKEFYDYEIMINEGREQKKILHDMVQMHNEIRNKLMDINFLKIEVEQQLELIKIKMENK